MIARTKMGACVAGVAAAVCFGCGGGDAGSDEGGATSASQAAFATACPGAWTSAPSYAGLVGTYVHAAWSPPAPQGELTSIAFLTEYPLDPSRESGAYYETTFAAAPRVGTYVAVPDNPAIGANLLLGDAAYPADGAQPGAIYFVLGLQHDALGRISAMCLGPTARGSAPFEIVRAF